MAGKAALDIVKRYESGNDIRQMVSCSEGGRALRLLKKREETKIKSDAARQEIDNETRKRGNRLASIDQKFGGSSADVLEEEFKKQTVGLMSVAEFSAKRKAIDDLIESSKNGKVTKRVKRKITTSKLSFDDPDAISDSDEEKSGSEEDEEEMVKPKKHFGKDPTIDTSFLYDASREEDLLRKKKALIEEYMSNEEMSKKEKLEVTYSYWDGTGHRRTCVVAKGFTINQFIAKCKLELERNDFPELRTLTVDSLMYVKEDLIIPANVTFHELIKAKARGKTGPLFNFDVHDDIRKADTRVERDDSHAGKIVDRKWYERNKHIFPACKWEMYSKEKVIDPNAPQNEPVKLGAEHVVK